MAFNRIAVYGHRGWVGSAVIEALAASGATIRVLHRPGSDISSLPSSSNLSTFEVDLEDQATLVSALEDIDIAILLVGQQGVALQYAFIEAIPKTQVKLLVPSDLAFRNSQQGLRVPVNKAKEEVKKAAEEAGIPTTIILPGIFAESSLEAGLAGVDIAGNRIIYSGDSENQQLNICTKKYVTAAYASIFAKTPVSQLQNRAIGLTELRVTGKEVRAALEKKHGTPPKISVDSLENIDQEMEKRIQQGLPTAMAFYCRKSWGTGQTVPGVGKDIWEVPGFEKTTLDDLIVNGKLEHYKDFPPQLLEELNATYK